MRVAFPPAFLGAFRGRTGPPPTSSLLCTQYRGRTSLHPVRAPNRQTTSFLFTRLADSAPHFCVFAGFEYRLRKRRPTSRTVANGDGPVFLHRPRIPRFGPRQRALRTARIAHTTSRSCSTLCAPTCRLRLRPGSSEAGIGRSQWLSSPKSYQGPHGLPLERTWAARLEGGHESVPFFATGGAFSLGEVAGVWRPPGRRATRTSTSRSVYSFLTWRLPWTRASRP